MSRPVILASSDLEVSVVPAWGARVTSVRHRGSGHELLFQAPAPGDNRETFGPWAFGWDDCWPSIDAGGPGYPDHGGLWNSPAEVVRRTTNRLEVRQADPGRWAVGRTWTVAGDGVTETVTIANLGSGPLEGFWTLHALVRIEDDMVLQAPVGTRRTVYGPDLGRRALPPQREASKFWFDGRVDRGRCGIDYPSLGMAYRLTWDPAELPYLGYWVTNGGFQGQRNAAWEPSEGFYDSVPTARAQGALPVLAPGTSRRFQFTVSWSAVTPKR